MSDKSTDQQQYELDRALLDDHGPSYIDTVCSFAEGNLEAVETETCMSGGFRETGKPV